MIINSSLVFSASLRRVTDVFHCQCVWPHSKFSIASGEQRNSPSRAVDASAPTNYFSDIRAGFSCSGLDAISNGFNLCGWKFDLRQPPIGAKSMTNELGTTALSHRNGFSEENSTGSDDSRRNCENRRDFCVVSAQYDCRFARMRLIIWSTHTVFYF